MDRDRSTGEGAGTAGAGEERAGRPGPGEPDGEPGVVERLEQAAAGAADRLRGSGVGTEDPHIVGDVGPTDVAPGRDPGERGPTAEEGEEPGAERDSDTGGGG